MEERDGIVVLVDENGQEIEFEHLDTLEMNGDRYVVLLPVEEEGDSDEVVILREEPTDEDEESYVSVDDEQELNRVFEEFKERMKDRFDFEEDEE